MTRAWTRRLAALGAAAVLAGMLQGSGAVARDDTTVEAQYECQLPSDVREVPVTFDPRLPERGAPGEPIRPDRFGVRARFAAPDIAALLPEGTRSVTSTAELRVTVEQGEETAEADWNGLKAADAALEDDDGLVLDHAGRVPSVTVGGAGPVTFSAGTLTLELLPDGAESESVRLVCSPRKGDGRPELGSVDVPEEQPETSPEPSGGPTSQSPQDERAEGGGSRGGIAVAPGDEEGQTGDCESDPLQLGADDLDLSGLPEPPPDAAITTKAGTLGCAFAVGFNNVAKLGGALIINDPRRDPIPVYVMMGVRQARYSGGDYPYWDELDHVGELELPDAYSTFLTFDFVPVSARVEFETMTPMTLAAVVRGKRANPMLNTIRFGLRIRLHDVEVNGTRLDVGDKCQTGRFETRLEGVQPEYSLLTGGPLRGKIDLPKFTGCGTAGGEDLNRLFTASLSGPDNYLELVQGQICAASVPGRCGAQVPPLPDLHGASGEAAE
ncbi:DUF6801 domain-containing protein [Streptomyces sulphureus]|uniref:DUF6801 domain-containing protein n=1 Tax=Streptomyces sulphureus TaxID=47758 RepID=UPI00036DC017|nr:DUF6801 domain-containing protein [Streptomyces sulphureus]